MNRLVFLLFFGICTHILNAQFADVVCHNGHIYTADESQSFVTAMAWQGNTLVYVGDEDGMQPWLGSDTEVHDLEGKTVLPGLFDTHIHLLEAGSEGAASCVLPWSENSVSGLVSALQACNPQPNINGWIFSWGHSIYPLLETNESPLELLSAAFPNTPVAAMDETSHSAWVNQAALDALSITGNTPDPVGGHIVLDANGEPYGLLLDAAGDLAFQAAYAPHESLSDGDYAGLVGFGLSAMATSGITSITEGRTYWKRGYHETWNQLHEEGLLTLRVDLAMYAYPEENDEAQIDSLLSLYDEGDEWLRAKQIKVYLDGVTLNGTAAMEEPYVYPFGWPFDSGLNYFTVDRLAEYITELELEGYSFHIHTIGNRGVREALDAIQIARDINGDIGAKHQLTHIEFVNSNDLDRFQELDVTANAQVTAWWTEPSEWQGNAYLVGAQVANSMIPIGSIHEAGGRVTLSSDWDVSSYNPFRSLENAVTRTPEALPSVADAVDSKTILAAISSRSDSYTGSIEVGKRADFICIDQDIFSIPHSAISETHVLLTCVDGVVVHDAGGFNSVQEPNNVIQVMPRLADTHIQLTSPFSGEFQIRDLNGRLVKQGEFPPGISSINVQSLKEGVHFLVVHSEEGLMTTRFVVVR